jgi:hypothetical protein
MQTFPVRSNIEVSITAATNALPIVITTDAAHELVNAETVDIQGLTDNTNANGNDLVVSSITSTTFTLAGKKGNGTYISGGTVKTKDAEARDYPAGTAASGTVRRFADAAQQDRFHFYVDCASDPSGVNKEVDVIVYGRVSDTSDWFVVQQLDETVAGWAQVASGRWLNTALDLPVHPQLRMDIVLSASSTNTVRGWIAL